MKVTPFSYGRYCNKDFNPICLYHSSFAQIFLIARIFSYGTIWPMGLLINVDANCLFDCLLQTCSSPVLKGWDWGLFDLRM